MSWIYTQIFLVVQFAEFGKPSNNREKEWVGSAGVATRVGRGSEWEWPKTNGSERRAWGQVERDAGRQLRVIESLGIM